MKLIIKIHSFVDIITNSSTSIFVVNTDKTLEVVDELIKYECEKAKELDWYNSGDYKIYYEDNKLIVYSFLNLPEVVETLLLNYLNATYEN